MGGLWICDSFALDLNSPRWTDEADSDHTHVQNIQGSGSPELRVGSEGSCVVEDDDPQVFHR